MVNFNPKKSMTNSDQESLKVGFRTQEKPQESEKFKDGRVS